MKRKLLVTLVALAMTVPLVACNSNKNITLEQPKVEVVESSTFETDVVVIGGGLAGLTAANSAVDGGVEVILVEKMGFTGGASMLSGGGLLGAETHLQKENNMDQTKDELREYYYTQQGMTEAPEGYPKAEYVDLLIESAPSTIKYLSENGVDFGVPASFYPETRDRLHFPKEGSGAGVTSPLAETAKTKGVEILLNTEATKITQEDGKITGILAKDKDGKEITIKAKSVILASGGFSRNLEMVKDLSEISAQHISVSGIGNVGDGYRMAEEVGADFHNEDWFIGLRNQAVEGKSSLNGLGWTLGLYTTVDGERFANENAPYSVLYNRVTDQGITEYFQIFDSSMSEMLEAELNKPEHEGVLFKGDSIIDIANKTGMNPEVLLMTIERYNELSVKGIDEDFGKQPENMKVIQEGVMYAIKVTPTQMGTMGGVVTNLDMQVIDTEGNIIEGLFAAGEMANRPFYGRVYVSGSALQIAATTGKIAGSNASK